MFDLCVKCWFVPKYVQRPLILRANREDALSMLAKLSREHEERDANELFRCLKMCKTLSRFQVFPYRCVEMSGAHENL